MQLSDLKQHYGPRKRRLQDLWTVVPSPPNKPFRVEAQVLWDSVWSKQHRAVLVRCVVDSTVSDALTVLRGQDREKWEALIRCCLRDVFESALTAAGRGFNEPGGISEFFEAVICSPHGVNSTQQLALAGMDMSLAELASNVDEEGRTPETLAALLRELRTTYAVDLCLALALQFLRILSSKLLLRRVTGGGLHSLVHSYVPCAAVQAHIAHS